MRKIFFPILLTFFSLTTLVTAKKASSQTAIDNCDRTLESNYKFNLCQRDRKTLTKQKWSELFKRYYRSRYRSNFTASNNFLSLKEVNQLLGFTGKRKRNDRNTPHQYWSWQDKENPDKKIEAIFVYHQLVGLRSKGFDRQDLQQLKVNINKQ